MRQLRRRAAERDQRRLLLLTAAQGSAAQKVWRMLERERKELSGERVRAASDSETPLCQEDFERMMKEEE